MKDKLEVGMYVRTKDGGIKKITNFKPITKYTKYNTLNFDNTLGELLFTDEELKEIKASHNIIDLIEYMDILVIENKLKDINNREIYLFNPVRCDGFTTFEDGKHCMIINMDYIIPIENIKVYQVLTHELFESMSYKLRDDK